MRPRMLMAGLGALAVAWLAPVPPAFWSHMTMHMVVVAVAAPLLALGVAGSRLDPVPRAPALFAPIPASMVELVAVWAWHAPAFHNVARHTTWGRVAEQATFLGTGLLLWLSALGGSGGARRAAGVIGLLLTSMHMTLLGALIALSPRALYHHSLEDQQLGGAIMLLIGGVVYLAGGVGLTVGLVRR